jgi:transposase
MPRHRAREFIRFLKKIDRVVAKSLDLHLIVDNYKTHKTKEVQAWLAKHPRHFTPTSSSWINLVERFFAEITDKRIRRDAFKSVDELRLPSPTIWESIMPTRSPSNGPPQSTQYLKRMAAPAQRSKR